MNEEEDHESLPHEAIATRESCHESARRSQEGPTPGNVNQPDYNNRRLTLTNSSGRKRQAATSPSTLRRNSYAVNLADTFEYAYVPSNHVAPPPFQPQNDVSQSTEYAAVYCSATATSIASFYECSCTFTSKYQPNCSSTITASCCESLQESPTAKASVQSNNISSNRAESTAGARSSKRQPNSAATAICRKSTTTQLLFVLATASTAVRISTAVSCVPTHDTT